MGGFICLLQDHPRVCSESYRHIQIVYNKYSIELKKSGIGNSNLNSLPIITIHKTFQIKH